MKRALDLSAGVIAAYPGKMLSEAGWDVVKVESVGGDPLRRQASRMGGGTGGAFAYLNHGKRSIITDEAQLLQLAEQSDVVVGDFSTQGCQTSGLSRALMQRLAPQHVLCSLSAFGLTGPKSEWCSSEMILQAASGMMFVTGEADGPPMQLPAYASAMTGGTVAASAILAAVRSSKQSGKKIVLDLALVEALTSLVHVQVDSYIERGEVARREQYVKQALRTVPAADGYIYCAPGAVSNVRMEGIAHLVGESRLAEERFQTAEGRMQNWNEYVDLMVSSFANRTAGEWFQLAEEHHLTLALVQTVDELFKCPQLQSRQLMRSVSVGGRGTVEIPGRPYRSSASCDEPRQAPAGPGEHTDAVLKEWLSEDADG